MSAPRRRAPLLALLLAALMLLRTPEAAHACECVQSLPESRFPTADAVFRGRVVRIDLAPSPPYGQAGLLVEVRDVRKGSVAGLISIGVDSSGGSSCLYWGNFRVGDEYLFYAHQGPNGYEPIGSCSRVVPIADAGEDYAYMLGVSIGRWPPPARAFFVLAFRVGVSLNWGWLVAPGALVLGSLLVWRRRLVRRTAVVS